MTCPWPHLTGHYNPFAVHRCEGHRPREGCQALPDYTHGTCNNLSLLTEWQGGDTAGKQFGLALHLSELGFGPNPAGSPSPPERAAVWGLRSWQLHCPSIMMEGKVSEPGDENLGGKLVAKGLWITALWVVGHTIAVPTNPPYPTSGHFRPKQPPESRQSSEITVFPALTPSQPPHPAAGRGTPLSDVRDRYHFQTITCFAQPEFPPIPTKHFLLGKASSKPLLCSCCGPRVGGSILQESKVCRIPGGLVAWSRRATHGSPPMVRGHFTPLALLPRSVLPNFSLLWRSSYTGHSRSRVPCSQGGSRWSPAQHSDWGSSPNWPFRGWEARGRRNTHTLRILFPTWIFSSIFHFNLNNTFLHSALFGQTSLMLSAVGTQRSWRLPTQRSKDRTMPSLINESKVPQSVNTVGLPIWRRQGPLTWFPHTFGAVSCITDRAAWKAGLARWSPHQHWGADGKPTSFP